MKVSLVRAALDDAREIAELRIAIAERLTRDFGPGPWSSGGSEEGVLYSMRNSTLLTARKDEKIIGVLQLCTRKPWAIDPAYFTACRKPIYLIGMAVTPDLQRSGIGRAMLEDAQCIAREWQGDAIRLDAYNAAAGAGEFYAKCGYREKGRVTYRKAPLIYYELLLPATDAAKFPAANLNSRS